MRVHMVGAEWFGTRPGGLNRYFQALFTAMTARPEVEVSAVAFGDAPPGGLAWPLRTSPLPVRVLASQAQRPRPRPEILDRHFAPYGPSTSNRVRPEHGSVIHFHGPWFAESLAAGQAGWKSALKRHWERARYKNADGAVVLCEAFRQILAGELEFPDERITVIPPGVDLSQFTFQPLLDDAAPEVLCVRRLERRMGIDTLLDAWPNVLRACPEARLSVVGEGTARAELEAQVDRLDLRGSVTLHGRLSDAKLNSRYRAARLTVVPTRSLEGFGLIALESLAVGRPVIVTDVGGLPDSVRGLDPSLIVPPDQPLALAERLVSALEGRVPTADRCRAHAESFAWELAVDRHLDLYRSILR